MKNRQSIYTKLVFTFALLVGGMDTSFSQKIVNESQIKRVVKQLDELSLQVREKRKILVGELMDLKRKKSYSTPKSVLAKNLDSVEVKLKQLDATLKKIAGRHFNRCQDIVPLNILELIKAKQELVQVKRQNQGLTRENNYLTIYLLLGFGFNLLLIILLYFRKFTRKILWWIRVCE